jgi:hypothetical protein
VRRRRQQLQEEHSQRGDVEGGARAASHGCACVCIAAPSEASLGRGIYEAPVQATGGCDAMHGPELTDCGLLYCLL